MDRLLAFTVLAFASSAIARGTAASKTRLVNRSHAELAATANTVVERGLHVELPPHISTLLGLTREQSCVVKQSVLRSAGKVEGIDVTEENHNDVVIFVVDETNGQADAVSHFSERGVASSRLLAI